MNREQVALVLAAFKPVFPRHEVTVEAVEMYRVALAPYSFDDVQAAVPEVLRTARFFPVPAEIIEAARRARRERLVAERERAAELEAAEYDRVAIPPPPDAVAALKRLGLPEVTP